MIHGLFWIVHTSHPAACRASMTWISCRTPLTKASSARLSTCNIQYCILLHILLSALESEVKRSTLWNSILPWSPLLRLAFLSKSLLSNPFSSPEVGVCLPMWRGNWKQAYTQSSHPIWVILGVFSPGTQQQQQQQTLFLISFFFSSLCLSTTPVLTMHIPPLSLYLFRKLIL